ncbi:hypothetical protein CK203_077827 [Vitis vinifera]|uniref:Uncharacterized protein n=1 Tax=Vitis vinifera TaxID=29760 RepID=A0A438EWV1_VITVI|nr:hypothetical protein CK203_077827 [Vitis vinifera]
MQPCLPLPLHKPVAQNPPCLNASILSGSSCADNSEWDFQKYGH